MKQILYLLSSMTQAPNRQVHRCYSPPKLHHKTLIPHTTCCDTRYITHFSRYVLQFIPFNVQGGSNMTGTDVARFTHKSSRSYLNHLVHSTFICIYTVTGYLQFYWTGSLWIIYCGRCLYTQCRE